MGQNQANIEVHLEDNLRCKCVQKDKGAQLETDGPSEFKGLGEHFSPTDLLAVSYPACILTVMGIKAQKLKVSLAGIKATVTKQMEDTPVRKITTLDVQVTCSLTFSDEIRKELEDAANHCPVHFSLHPCIKKTITFSWGQS